MGLSLKLSALERELFSRHREPGTRQQGFVGNFVHVIFVKKKKKKRPDTQTELEHSRKARNVLLPLVALRVIVDISTSETL